MKSTLHRISSECTTRVLEVLFDFAKRKLSIFLDFGKLYSTAMAGLSGTHLIKNEYPKKGQRKVWC